MGQNALGALDGRPVVVRTAAASDADELRAEVELLTALRGLPVPEVVELHEFPDGLRAVVTFTAPARHLDVALLASVAATLADAHDRGIVHGALDAGCIGRGPLGATVCGWTGRGDPAGDVAALGALLAQLVDDRAPNARHVRPLIGALAGRAGADDPTARPSMRAVATSLAAMAISPLPFSVALRPIVGRSATRNGARRRRLVIGAAGAALVMGGFVVFGGVGASRDRSSASVVAGRGPIAGNRVHHDAAVVQVGEPGDVVVLGDWDCDGEATPALLRAKARELWRWPAWEAQPLRRTAQRRATSLRVVTDAAGCDRLVQVDGDGRRA